MLRINEIPAPLGTDAEKIKKLAADFIGVHVKFIKNFEIAREAIDSRKKNNIRMIYCVNLEIDGDEESIALKFPANKVHTFQKYEYIIPKNKRNSLFRPVIIGFGPAGMFAALILAKAGLNPLALERGNDADTRTRDVYDFWKNGKLNVESNVQFGEGGAGAFSDGKLNTGIKDSRCRFVIESFYKFGAPEQILYSAHPHIGTDNLGSVVKNIRSEIIGLGGEVRFGCRLTDIYTANGYIQGIACSDASGKVFDIETDCLLLCIGHSARDTFEMLYSHGVKMELKAFSVGVRIEHPQELINKAVFGPQWNCPLLGAANYKLSDHYVHSRGGYTFCMCPGGTVVCASSETAMVAVNGMSRFARDGENANSAVLVGIEPNFFSSSYPLAGIEFQRKIERRAFEEGGGGYAAPAQLAGDFLKGIASKKQGCVTPTCTTGVCFGDIRRVLPSNVTETVARSLIAFDKKLSGFALPDAVITAPESRSSSPVRILRDSLYQSSVKGIYPCGEGAGYAGGIVSAAVDGIKCAEKVLADEADDF